MPCYEPTGDRATIDYLEADKRWLTAALCALMSSPERDAALSKIDWSKTGLMTRNQIMNWYANHMAEDVRKAELKQERDAALRKLSDRERTLLGIAPK